MNYPMIEAELKSLRRASDQLYERERKTREWVEQQVGKQLQALPIWAEVLDVDELRRLQEWTPRTWPPVTDPMLQAIQRLTSELAQVVRRCLEER